MYFIFKLIVVILILYQKLNGLNTTPLIDRNKTTISDEADSGRGNNSQTATDNDAPPFLANGSANYDNENVDNDGGSDDNDDSQYNSSALTSYKSTSLSMSTNLTTIEVDNSIKHLEPIASQAKYFYNIVNEDAAEKQKNVTFPAILNNRDKRPAEKYSDELESELGLVNSVHETVNNSDVDRFLLKYDSDDGNTCLLDDLKEKLMWWSWSNGSLREANFNFTSKYGYLDLSYHNVTQDENLCAKTRAYTFIRDIQIVAFSVAHNNLTSAPYKTLSLMNSTLKFLTLKGNQFAAYTLQEEKYVLNRILNDTTRNTDDANMDSEMSHEDHNIFSEYQQYQAQNKHNHNRNRNNNNNNNEKLFAKKEEGIAWATFPAMPVLVELDISSCHIEYVTSEAFANLTNLHRLYIAHNKMLTIPFDTFQHVPLLQYLDMSFTNVLDFDYQIPLPTLEAILNLIYGVKIQQTAFKYLPNLVYLDLSHTKLTRNSAVAFTHLGEKLKFLSLCYTAFPMVGNALFKNTALVGLDLSGNPYAAYNIIDDAFEGVADSLKYLYFEHSNIKDLAWLRCLQNLRVLGLSGNNINYVSLETFSPLKSLQILDLSSNHVGNWYTRALVDNEQLRVLNLRDNNINIITSEMLRDFQVLDYLSLGDNNFVCDCLLRDLVDISAANNKDANCSRNVLQGAQEILADNMYWVGEYMSPNVTAMAAKGVQQLQQLANNRITPANFDSFHSIDLSQTVMERYVPQLRRSYRNLRLYNIAQKHLKMQFVSRFYSVMKADSAAQCPQPESILIYDKLNGSSLKFQLLDYEEEHYWCFNETERMNFVELNCLPRTFVEDITQQIHTLTKYIVICVSSLLVLSLVAVIIYLKRWHIHYYYSSLKSAALVSSASKESQDKFDTLAEQDPNLVYDIFISYCQNDRQWVLEELLPNVEEAGDVSICMHERDFQIGLTILDNIISCMDRSRALMLIISTDFLLSHWCQFEMHLAQHRIFEVSKEHLILVFLEDIPRSKRPKTLQYLMEVKTYIKWPSAKGNRPAKSEDRNIFWKRMKRSLHNIGVNQSRA